MRSEALPVPAVTRGRAPAPVSTTKAPADAAGATQPPFARLAGHRLVVEREPEGRAPTGRPWMALTVDLPRPYGIDGTLDQELAWCIREAERIEAQPDRAAVVWLRGQLVTLYVDNNLRRDK